MLSNYISYLKKLNSRLQQNGIYLDVRFDVPDNELLWETDKLTQYLEFNHILMSADSNTAIYDLHGFTELSVSEFLSEKFKKEYEEEWNRVYHSLETTPIDAGKLPNKPIKTVSGELLADFMSQMNLSEEGYSNNLLASLGISDTPTEDVFTEGSDYDEPAEDFSELEEDDNDEFAEDSDLLEDADEVLEDDDEFAEDSDIMDSDADIVDDEWLEEDDLEDDSDIDADLEDTEFEEDDLEDDSDIDTDLEDTEFEEESEDDDLEDEDFEDELKDEESVDDELEDEESVEDELEDEEYDDDLEDSDLEDSETEDDLEDSEDEADLEDSEDEADLEDSEYEDDSLEDEDESESELGYDEDYLDDDEDESELGYDDVVDDEDDFNSKGFFSNPEIDSLSENSFIQAKEARKPRRDKSEDSADALVDITNKVIVRVFSDKSAEKLANLFSRKK